jgi:phage terminase large subunit-like protein
VEVALRRNAGRIVAEANQGGEMVRTMLAMAVRELGAQVRLELRHAGKSKRDRAEPVSGWLQRGELKFAGVFRDLEDELCSFGAPGQASPDRMDALVWAACELKEAARAGARVRGV